MRFPLHQLSAFRPPKRKGKGASCPLIEDIRQTYWLGVKLRIANFGWTTTVRNNRLFNKGAVIALYGAVFIPIPGPAHTIYLDPIISLPKTETVATIQMPELAPQTGLETALHELKAYGTYANSFAPLNCTWGVASRLPVTWSGNANEWDNNAAAQGYTVSATPKVGAIAVSENDSYLGHVGVVVSLTPLTVWEENYNGPGVTDTRPANPGEFSSFIYF